MGQLITKYQQRGGSLPPGFGAELTDEQRTLLAERIKTEKAGLRTLLQDLIDRDKEVQQMKTRLDQLETQLPASVVSKEGDRHDRIAMNFLVKQGVPAKKAYEIVSQINLQDALVPGFRVWTYYQKGQFGTWVTRGKASITPQEHAKKVLALLEESRDKALKDLADTSSERDALKTATVEKEAALTRSAEELKAMTETAEQQRAEVQRREVEANTLRFIVGSKKALVKSKLLEKNMRKWNPATDQMSSLNLLESQEIPIDAASLGLKKVKKVTLVPEIFLAGVDYAVQVGGPTATLQHHRAGQVQGEPVRHRRRMTRRPVAAAAVAVVVLASGVGGWLLWMGRSPFGRAAATAPEAGTAPAQTASTTRARAPPAGPGCCGRWPATPRPRSASPSRATARARSRAAVTATGPSASGTSPRGQPVTRFTGHGTASDILTVAFTPDGAAAISAAGPEDDSLRIWDVASGAERTQLSGDIGLLFRAISEDATLALAQEMTAEGRSKGFSLWRLDEGRRIVGVDAPDHASALAIAARRPDGALGRRRRHADVVEGERREDPLVRRARPGHHRPRRRLRPRRPPARHERRRRRRQRHRTGARRDPLGSRNRRRVPHHPQRHALRARRRRPHPRGRRRRHLDPRPRRHHRPRAGAARRARRRRHGAGLRARRDAPRLDRRRSHRPRVGPSSPGASPQ